MRVICSHKATSAEFGDVEVIAAEVDELESTGSKVISHPVIAVEMTVAISNVIFFFMGLVIVYQ